jgi:hypothetical protein
MLSRPYSEPFGQDGALSKHAHVVRFRDTVAGNHTYQRIRSQSVPRFHRTKIASVFFGTATFRVMSHKPIKPMLADPSHTSEVGLSERGE